MRLPYQWVIVGVLWVTHTVYFLNYMTVGTLAPLIQPELRLTSAQIGLLSSAVTIGSLLIQIPAGFLSDRFGAKWVMASGLLLMAVSAMAISSMSSYLGIFLLLIWMGIGIGCNQTPASKAIVMWFSLKGRATAMGIKQTGVTMGGVLASFFLPMIALQFQGWRSGFRAAGWAAFVSTALLLLTYKKPPEEPKESLQSTIQWRDSFLKLLSERDFLMIGAAGILLMLVQFAFSAHFVLYATSVLHFPVKKSGVLLGLAFLTGAIGRVGWSVVSDYFFSTRRKIVITLIGLFGALVMAGFLLLGEAPSARAVCLLALLFGLTGLSWNGVYLTSVGEFPGKALAGLATGIIFVIVNVGAIAGPPLFGHLVDLTGGYHASWLLTSFCMAMVAFLSKIQRKERLVME